MFNPLTTRVAWFAPAMLLVLAAAAGCGPKSNLAAPSVGQLGTAVTASPATPDPSAQTTPDQPPKPVTTTGAPAPAQPNWPTPEDCVSYNPANLTVHWEGGSWLVTDATTVALRVDGDSGDMAGQQALALAQHYRKHCFIGRNNNRVDAAAFVFDYWRSASGMTPAITGLDDLCSDYNRNNLTVEDMGNGDGWRVKDHDHVLQLFADETDARNGKLVLAKYNRICTLGTSDSDVPDLVSFFL
jgi:hypothetical protein